MGLLHRLAQQVHTLSLSHLPASLRPPRRTHLYCVGTAKSGTNSIEALFGNTLRARHEAESEQAIETILKLDAGEISDTDLRQYLRRRDRRLSLEIDSSQLNYFFLEALLDLFPESRFILTLRDPYSWVDSFINHQLSRSAPHKWSLLRDLRFRAHAFTHPPEEAALKERDLYTLDGYLSYWTTHNRTVLDTVPDNRLLVVRTHKISERTPEIAAFAGVPATAANRHRSHANKAKRRLHVLKKIDVVHLHRKVEVLCGPLLREYFPQVSEPRDALAYLPPLPATTRS